MRHYTNMASFRTLDPAVGRWWSLDVDAEQFPGMSPYNSMLNSPIVLNDPNGDNPLLIGAAIGLVSNGAGNLASGNGFFDGAFQSAFMGAIGGGISNVIGGVASGINNSLNRAVFQFGAHSFTGGLMSYMQGGSFLSGAAAGGISSGVGSGIGALKGGSTAQWLGGGLSGGLGSLAAGGSFWSGAGQGLVTNGLNHAAHSLINNDPPWLKELKQAYKEFWESLGFGDNIPSYTDVDIVLADTEAKVQELLDIQLTALSLMIPGPFDDALAAKYVTGRIIQKGGNKLTKDTLKALNLSRNEANKAIHALKDFEGLPANFHGRITRDGYYLHPSKNINYGRLYDYLD